MIDGNGRAYIGTREFLSVADAIAAAKPGDVILVPNIDTASQFIVIDKKKSPPGALQG